MKHEYLIEHNDYYLTYNLYNTIFKTVLICISWDFILDKLIMFNSHEKRANIGKYERFCGYIDGSVFIIFQIGFQISEWRGACLCRSGMDRGHPSVCGG